MTPALCCPASCDCWRNWRSGTTCPRASTRASTTSGRVQESQAQPSGIRSGPAAHRSHALVRPAARWRAHREDRRPLPAGRSGRGHGTGRVLRPDRPRQDHPDALTAARAPAREPPHWKECSHKTAVSAGSRRVRPSVGPSMIRRSSRLTVSRSDRPGFLTSHARVRGCATSRPGGASPSAAPAASSPA
jgi:hypothetical protein